MKVALFPADQTACGHYRMIWPATVAAASGELEVEFGDRIPIRRTARSPSRVVDARVDADVVVLQRPLDTRVVEAIPHLQRHGSAVVVEVDDDFTRLHVKHPMFRGLHPQQSHAVNWRHLLRACALADAVTVTTPALADRYAGGKGWVLPNLVPAQLLEVHAEGDGRTVGWGGFTATHVDDLTVTRGGVARALEETGARFAVVGSGDGVRAQLALSSDPAATGPLPFAEYHQALAQIDVGIAPLLDTKFNAAKSALKLLEYAALGIAAVASPRADYLRLHNEGIGLLATDRARDWRRQVRLLLTDHACREDTAARAKAIVAERHTYERQAWRWAEAWQHAIDRRRSTRAA